MATLSSKARPLGVATSAQGVLADTAVQPAAVVNSLTVNGNAYPSAGALSNRNKVINGGFDVWQRSVSDARAAYFHVADRWLSYGYSGASSTFSRQAFTLGQTDVPQNPKYFARVASTNLGPYLEHRIESLSQFSGQTITLSFWAKSPDVTSSMKVGFYLNYGSAGSGPENITEISVGNLSPSWQKFTRTITVASFSGKTISGGNDYFELHLTTSNATATLDLAQVQLELGDTATPFEHRSYGQELALCERYYETGQAEISQAAGPNGFTQFVMVYRQTKRANPTTVLTNSFTAGGGSSDRAICSYKSGSQSTTLGFTADAEL
jgi:hypothetical protein